MGDAVGVIVAGVIGLAFIIFMIAAMWKVFTKAGQPGWAAIIPFYNIYVLLKIVGRPGWWLVLYFIPLVNIVVSIIVLVDVSKSYGKPSAFAILLYLLPIVGFPILGFGSATYVGPAAAEGSAGGQQGPYGQDPAYPPQQGYSPSGPYPPQPPPGGPYGQ